MAQNVTNPIQMKLKEKRSWRKKITSSSKDASKHMIRIPKLDVNSATRDTLQLLAEWLDNLQSFNVPLGSAEKMYLHGNNSRIDGLNILNFCIWKLFQEGLGDVCHRKSKWQGHDHSAN